MRERAACRVAAAGLAAALAAGCSADPGSPGDARHSPPDSPPVSPPASPATTAPATPVVPSPSRSPLVRPRDGRAQVAMAAVRYLAGRVGRRPGTSPAYQAAARYVERRLSAAGWTVTRQHVPTPAGVSWGVPVPAGRSTNLVAAQTLTRRPAAGGDDPWLLVGAHLDTVPQAPGAEDNASGVGVLLAVAEALRERRARLPVVLVAFGSEEPRGPTDDDHHYGSRAFVAALPPAERRGLRGMGSLDRGGVGSVVPVGSPGSGGPLQRELLGAARRAGVPAVAESGQRSSDHWSFARAGLPGVRLGGTPYAAYHSARDVPSVVSAAQLARTLRITLSWLGGQRRAG